MYIFTLFILFGPFIGVEAQKRGKSVCILTFIRYILCQTIIAYFVLEIFTMFICKLSSLISMTFWKKVSCIVYHKTASTCVISACNESILYDDKLELVIYKFFFQKAIIQLDVVVCVSNTVKTKIAWQSILFCQFEFSLWCEISLRNILFSFFVEFETICFFWNVRVNKRTVLQ